MQSHKVYAPGSHHISGDPVNTSLIGAGLIGGFIFLLCGLMILIRGFDISNFAEILMVIGALFIIGTLALAYVTRDKE